MKKTRHTAHRPNTAATPKTAQQFSYGGLTFELQGTTRELFNGVECDQLKLVVLVPYPNGLWERTPCTVRLSDQAALIRSLDAIVGMIEFVQLSTKCIEQLNATAKGVHHA